MKAIVQKKFKIIIVIFICLIITLGSIIGIFYMYKYHKNISEQQLIGSIYDIYSDKNREEIITNIPISNGIPAIGILEINSIGYKGIVVEGTSQENLSKGIGLFEHSNILGGNVCMAGHNYKNFLANLKDVQLGDTIKYYTYLGNKQYAISDIKQIEETDWSMLENTEDNRLTIITCVKGQSNLRLCVQALEIK